MPKNRYVWLWLLLAVALGAGPGCGGGGVRLDPTAQPFARLSEYGFFVGNPSELQPNEGVVPYDLNTPLFSDYAFKSRFVWLPPGTAARYNDTAAFDFPVGAVLIKHFYYPADFRQPTGPRKLVETRLLVHRPDGWEALPYIWNEAQTEATLQVAGGQVPVSWVHTDGQPRTLSYTVPNKHQCRGCHISGKKMVPIGPKARNLNRTLAYPNAGEANQLGYWQQVGYLEGAPDATQAPKVAVWDNPATGDLNARARAYLDVNCGHCHNPGGPGKTTGFNLHYAEQDPVRLGFCKSPVAAGHGSGDWRYDIFPGEPDKSILVFRMITDQPGLMMPELGRKLQHTEGVALIREWIASLRGDCNEKESKIRL